MNAVQILVAQSPAESLQRKSEIKRRPTVRVPLSEMHVDVALADINDVKALTRMGRSWIHDAVRKGEFPAPVIREPRFTRWRLADVRAWLADRIALAANDVQSGEATRHLAKRASDAANSKRRATVVTAE